MKPVSCVCTIVVFTFTFLLLSIHASAAESGSIHGVITDPVGALLPDARVELLQQEKQIASASTENLDVFDALRQVPGMQVVRTGQAGSNSSLFLRGGNSNANKVLLDGVPAND